MLYLTGDTHGENVERFSFKKNKGLKTLTKDDIFVVLGDTAIGWPDSGNYTKYTMEQLKCKPFTIIFVFGNHDNYDWAETLPQVDVFGGTMRQIVVDDVVYENRYIVDSWTVADLSGYHCLLCAHAKSHDIQHLYREDDYEGIAMAKKRGEWFRVAHKTWWPQEELDTEAIEPFIQEHENERFDAILTHDCPGMFCHIAGPDGGMRLKPTSQEDYFDSWRERLSYEVWVHGHLHYEFFCYRDYEAWYRRHENRRLYCIYHCVFSIEDIIKCDENAPYEE